MLGRIIFCAVIAAAVLAVVLLATVSPLPRRSADHSHKGAPPNLKTLTVYIHLHPTAAAGTVQQQQQQQWQEASALVFRHKMTVGPESTSRAVGAASGFALHGEGRTSAMSVFDTVHLSFDAAAGLYSGSLCVQAGEVGGEKAQRQREDQLLRVVGGTGAFAFGRGQAVLRAAPGKRLGSGGGAAATALRLELSVVPAQR